MSRCTGCSPQAKLAFGRTLRKITPEIQNYAARIPINHVGYRTKADEICLTIKGVEHYLFGTTDAKTCFLHAQDLSDRKEGTDAARLLWQSVNRAGKYPTEFTTDCLGSCGVAHHIVLESKNSFDEHCTHVADPDAATRNKKSSGNSTCNLRSNWDQCGTV